MQTESRQVDQLGQRFLKHRNEVCQPLITKGINTLAPYCQLAFPNCQALSVHSITSEKCIPMLQRTLGALPRSIKLMFHVKHTPVEKLPPRSRWSFKEAK